MELLYFYIKEDSIFNSRHTNLALNLNSKYDINFDSYKQLLTLSYKRNITEDFFELTRDKSCKTLDILGIIGVNGAGKTSAIESILAAMTVGGFDLIVCEDNKFIKIFISSSELDDIKIETNLNKKVILSNENNISDSIEVIYYSNIFDANSNLYYNMEVLSPAIHNISTNFLLNFAQYFETTNFPFTQRDTFKSEEISRYIIFYLEKTTMFFRSIPFDIPKEIKLKLIDYPDLIDYDFINDYYRNLHCYSPQKKEDFINHMHINIFINLLDIFKSNKSDIDTVIKYFFDSGEKTGDFLTGNIRQLLDSLLRQSKTMGFWIERGVENLICYLDLFQKLIDSEMINFTNNTIILQREEVLCDFIECNNTLSLPIILFDWYELSSGEKSLLSFYSRFYDIVRKKQVDKEYISILIDELDTCFHPEWQRQIISSLIDICNAFFENKHVKVIITSNSPFIASDLPSNNIIFLQKHTNVYNELETNFSTFGSNIHTLYSNAFFMKNGVVGEFAKRKINNIIDMIKPSSEKIYPELTKEHFEKLQTEINIIGEPILKGKLQEMLNKCRFGNKSFEQLLLEKQKAEIEKKLEILRKKQGDV